MVASDPAFLLLESMFFLDVAASHRDATYLYNTTTCELTQICDLMRPSRQQKLPEDPRCPTTQTSRIGVLSGAFQPPTIHYWSNIFIRELFTEKLPEKFAISMQTRKIITENHATLVRYLKVNVRKLQTHIPHLHLELNCDLYLDKLSIAGKTHVKRTHHDRIVLTTFRGGQNHSGVL